MCTYFCILPSGSAYTYKKTESDQTCIMRQTSTHSQGSPPPPSKGGHLDSNCVRMCVHKIEYKGMFLNSDRVTRVTRLGYGIRPKMAKRGCFFSKVVLKRVHFRKFLQKLRKKGYILSSHNLKRVPFSPPVTTRKGSHFENRFLTWVPTLTPSDPQAMNYCSETPSGY
jgi:hypothetical protein